MHTIAFVGTEREAIKLGRNLPLHCREVIKGDSGKNYLVPINAIRRNQINDNGYRVEYLS